MGNAILIKEVNNQPIIFNVDNAMDIASLEALQALKMPEDLVGSVFGEQSNFADNTTCTVSSNANNPAFPYDIVFDASRIIETPKRYYGHLAEMAMPSNKYIHYSGVKSGSEYRAPANGYFVLYVSFGTGNGFCRLRNRNVYFASESRGEGEPVVFVPVLKDQVVAVTYESALVPKSVNLYFVYAEGEI